MVFTIFIWFEGKTITLDSVSYPKLCPYTTVWKMKEIVRQRVEMIVDSSKTGYSIHLTLSGGKLLEKDSFMICDYGLSNMGSCNAYFRPYNKIVDYNRVKNTLEVGITEDILDVIKSCKKNKNRRSILLTRKFQFYTKEWTSFWEHILEREFCSLMVPCVRLGMPVNQQHRQYSALSIALHHNKMNVVRDLLLLGANPVSKSRFVKDWYLTLMTPLEFVPVGVSLKMFSERKGLKYLQLLIDSNADLSERVLFTAVRKGQSKITRWLMRKGCNLEKRDDYNKTPLMIAVWNEDINITRQLHYLGGASPNVKNPNMKNFTPFMQAVWLKNIAIVTNLLWDPRKKRKKLEDILRKYCSFTDTIIDLIWSMVPVPKVDFSLTDKQNRTVFDIVESPAMREFLYRSLEYH